MKPCRLLKRLIWIYLIVSGVALNLLLLGACVYIVHEDSNGLADRFLELAKQIGIDKSKVGESSEGSAEHQNSNSSGHPSDTLNDAPLVATKPSPLPKTFGYGRLITVGLDGEFKRIEDAAYAAKNGDIVEITADTYHRHTAIWRANDIVIRGRGGIAVLDARDTILAQEKAIWVIRGNNYRLENIGFKNATSPARNGAGIRSEGVNLSISNCFFRDNETAVLAGRIPESAITIEHSEFARNGHDDGQAHQLYIGHVKSATLRFNYIHHAHVGSSIKSRAQTTFIMYNRILDGVDGTGNYSIDISEGGRAFVLGNTIQQSRYTNNSHMISFGPEFSERVENVLVVAHNTLVNDRSYGTFIVNHTSTPAYVYNNYFIGHGKSVVGLNEMAGNVTERSTLVGLSKHDRIRATTSQRRSESDSIASRLNFNFHPTLDSPTIDAGVELEPIDGFALVPKFEYRHPMIKQIRHADGKLDAGAYEFDRENSKADIR